MRGCQLNFVVVFLPSAFFVASLFAQDRLAPARPRCFEQANGARKAYLALPATARYWLSEDAVYVISPEEHCAFLHLQTDQERDQFIEQFWYRRSSNPKSPSNDFKNEHYRRIAFANENFSGPLVGWKTDRGRTYILLGPPDSIDSPAPAAQGTTSTDNRLHPSEKWHYLNLEGIGELDLEFVYAPDYGDYRFALPENQWQALLGGYESSQQQRTLQASYPPVPGQLEIYVGPAPVQRTRFKDLEAVVTAHIVRNQVHFSHSVTFSKATHATTLAHLAINIPTDRLTYHNGHLPTPTAFELFVRVRKPSGSVMDTIELVSDDKEKDEATVRANLTRQAETALPPGSYRLAIVAKDMTTGEIGSTSANLDVPSYEALEKLPKFESESRN